MAIDLLLETLDEVSDELKPYYKQDGENFILDVSGIDNHPDIGALRRAKDYEKSARVKAEKTTTELQGQILALTEERDGLLKDATPRNVVEKLEASWKKKYDSMVEELTNQNDGLKTSVEKVLLNSAIDEVCSISDTPRILRPHVKDRLLVEYTDEGPVTRVLDKDGGPSAQTIDELKKEFFTDPDFSSIVTGSKASGGGAPSSPSGGGAPSRLDYSSATPKQMVADLKARNGGNHGSI